MKPSAKNFDAIDLCKLIAALFVVSIHTDPLESVSESANFMVADCLSRFAVPFFFVSSSFFFFRGGVDGQKLKHYEKRMCILYAIWYVIAFPVTFMRKYSVWFTEYSLPVAIWKCCRGLLFASSFRGSWFLSGSMFCAAVIYFLGKRMSTKKMIVLTSVPYLFCVLCSTYGHLLDWIGLGQAYDTFLFFFPHPYTSIITGLQYFAIGKYFAEHEAETVESSTKKYAVLTALTMVALCLEAILAKQNGLVESTDCLLMIIPHVWCLMKLVLSLRIHLPHVKEIRASGVIVFFIHFGILYMFQQMDRCLGIHIDSVTRYLLILLISFSFAGFVLRMEKREHCHWMRYLH
ncbi:MAG: acyltransferase family protein [Butyricicoccus sp.]